MLELIKNCFKYFFSNSVTPEIVSSDTKITIREIKEPEKVWDSPPLYGIYSISEDISPSSVDAACPSSEEFDDEKYAISSVKKLIKQQRKIFKNIKEGKILLDKFTYISLKTNRENFRDIIKDIKSKDKRDKYTYLYYKDINKFNDIINYNKT
jgi:hypothetical protein